MIREYKRARYELLSAAMAMEGWDFGEMAEGDGPRAVATRNLIKAAKVFKVSLKFEGKKRGLGYGRMQRRLSTIEEPEETDEEAK